MVFQLGALVSKSIADFKERSKLVVTMEYAVNIALFFPHSIAIIRAVVDMRWSW